MRLETRDEHAVCLICAFWLPGRPLPPLGLHYGVGEARAPAARPAHSGGGLVRCKSTSATGLICAVQAPRPPPRRLLASTTEWGRREHRPQGRRTAEGALCVAGRGPRPASSARFKLPGHPCRLLPTRVTQHRPQGRRTAEALCVQATSATCLIVAIRAPRPPPPDPRYARAPSPTFGGGGEESAWMTTWRWN